MLPKIVNVSDFRKNIASFLSMPMENILIIKGKSTTKVVIDEEYFNYLTSLANQFIYEDPEGKYRPEFEEEILKRAKSKKFDENVKSLQDLL